MSRLETIDFERVQPGRVYFHYLDLEEYHAGFWKSVYNRDIKARLTATSVKILRDRDIFSGAVQRVIKEWPNSCLAEFTAPGNHRAWLGQAACCLVAGVPENLTRLAWWKLTEVQRIAANDIAEIAIRDWRIRRVETKT